MGKQTDKPKEEPIEPIEKPKEDPVETQDDGVGNPPTRPPGSPPPSDGK